MSAPSRVSVSTPYADPDDPLDALTSQELEEQAFGPDRRWPGRRSVASQFRPVVLVARPAHVRLVLLASAVLTALLGVLYVAGGRAYGGPAETPTVFEEVVVLEAE